MKRAAKVVAVLGAVVGMCALSFGQSTSKPAAQNPPAGQAAQPAGQAAAPAGKRAPAAKTQPEFDAYKAAVVQTDPAALEKAADDFAAKFPDSELRALLYKAVMVAYQQANNADKMLAIERKLRDCGFHMFDVDGAAWRPGQACAENNVWARRS